MPGSFSTRLGYAFCRIGWCSSTSYPPRKLSGFKRLITSPEGHKFVLQYKRLSIDEEVNVSHSTEV